MIQWSRCCQCSFWLKYSLFALNFLIWVGGLVAVVIGICAWIDNAHDDLMSRLPTLPASLLIVVGGVSTFVGLVGFLGAVRESFCLLKMFCAVASILFLCEIVGGILMFTLMDYVRGTIASHIRQAIVQYQTDERLRDFIDYIQRKLECCGASDYRDWDANHYFSCTVAMSSKLHCSVPMSCCAVHGDVYCGLRVRPNGELSMESSVYSRGCTDLLLNAFKSSLIYISILAFAIGISEVIGVVLANALMHSILNNATASHADECDGLHPVRELTPVCELTVRPSTSFSDDVKADVDVVH